MTATGVATVRYLLTGYAASRRSVPPLIATATVLVLLHAGGPADPALGYATSAAVLLPIFAWAARQLLDTEPDVQRELTAVAVGGPGRAAGSALAAALVGTLPLGALALAWPWAVGAFVVPHGGPRIARDVLVGLAVHLLSAVPATVLGGWTSRAVLPDRGHSALTLLAGSLGAILLGLPRVPGLPWLAPPLAATLRAANSGSAGLLRALPGLSLHTVLWAVVVSAGYLAVRRRRA